jgi:hypothetical protein
MSSGVTDTDMGWSALMRKILSWGSTDGQHVKVGIQGDAGQHPSGMDNVRLASIHEFGQGVRERPFIRSTIDTNLKVYQEALDKAVDDSIAGKSSLPAELGMLGENVRAGILDTIAKSPGVGGGPLKGWAKSTLKAKEANGKGGDTVLWDTGTLRNSITSKVFGGGAK